ncbi:UDP-3-O-(3-hydroxymyristoyl) glucosamine N-acyltransferase [Mesotoga sp. Brook.08.105.5.1]|uniref:acyltransferase n=1 Tax=Mesotoga sp. Brook.08.105.5.1 TaxID=1421002 RepID=UPI000C18D622|nr:acyltransferase [Mesotoga sp. Brook.08.105.5.1]PNQ05605.1 UDP-3-O-(3-hydroxymyristoyl) glucosamine N-acyltransferase [Mesotoga sp. SC_NapDC3]PVD17857.1 UDP-3-O-(3-hydroxymyristoyl) glucosamine N-acyltransferase [Mesotoga sp. Brook.08.105.5.1]PXF34747.1 UDP-3-O-(3-hydroxymyristoyl) glucosamine N-acyltransferase [Mesotoga sp. SC_NapDC]
MPSIQKGINVIIEDGSEIGENCVIGHNVVIHKGVVIGDYVTIGDNTVLGKEPFAASTSATTSIEVLQPLAVGNGTTIGASCVIYKGASLGEKCFVGDLATIREKTKIGEKTIVGKGATVENGTSVGKRVKIETGAYITAFSTIEDYCFIAPEVTFTNDNFLGRTEERKKHFKGPTLKRGARIGANATILPGITIGEDALVAAGSVVTRDVAPRKIYAGIPAKYIREVSQEQLIEEQEYYEK